MASGDHRGRLAGAGQFGAMEDTGWSLQTEQDAAPPAMPGLGAQTLLGVRCRWFVSTRAFAAGRFCAALEPTVAAFVR